MKLHLQPYITLNIFRENFFFFLVSFIQKKLRLKERERQKVNFYDHCMHGKWRALFSMATNVWFEIYFQSWLLCRLRSSIVYIFIRTSAAYFSIFKQLVDLVFKPHIQLVSFVIWTILRRSYTCTWFTTYRNHWI